MSHNSTVRKKLRRFIEKTKEVSSAARECLNPRSEFFGMSLTETLRGEIASKTQADPFQDNIELVHDPRAALREALLIAVDLKDHAPLPEERSHLDFEYNKIDYYRPPRKLNQLISEADAALEFSRFFRKSKILA